MLHDNKEEWIRVLETTSAQTGFPLLLLEKDYYLTLLLSKINTISDDLIFKGGTCLNKVYYSYSRLSEDLDFTLRLPSDQPTRAIRRQAIQPVKDNILSYVQRFGMTIESLDHIGFNQSTQYIIFIDYDSVVIEKPQSVKLEIGLRFNPILPTQKKAIAHRFLHPFTRQPFFDGGSVFCLDLTEIVAEKMRAGATRLNIAPRDFYDLGSIIQSGFDFSNPNVWEIFQTKLAEDGFDTDLSKYRINLGRSQTEISDMVSRIEAELLAVLTPQEQRSFDLDQTLLKINKIIVTIHTFFKNNKKKDCALHNHLLYHKLWMTKILL